MAKYVTDVQNFVYLQGKMHTCCSEYTISFHYITPSDMKLMYFLLYKVHIFGIPSDPAGTNLYNTIFTDPAIKPRANFIQSLPDPVHLTDVTTAKPQTTPKPQH